MQTEDEDGAVIPEEWQTPPLEVAKEPPKRGRPKAPKDDDNASKMRSLAERIAANTPPVAKPSRPMVWFGSEGPDVAYLQERLDRLGLYSVPEGDDVGRFGVATDRAVRAFQSTQGLEPSALVDAKTWDALQE